MSTELFDKDGYITESLWGTTRWRYVRGVPTQCERETVVYVKEGERWVAKAKE